MPDDLRGSVDVPRAALIAFQEFLERFRHETVTGKEVVAKIRWLESLLKQDDDDS